LKHRVGELDPYKRHRRTLRLSGDPADNLTLGERAATSQGFMDLAVKAAKSSESAGLALDEDISLATAGPAESKTLLRMGLVTSAGAFQSVDDSGDTAPLAAP